MRRILRITVLVLALAAWPAAAARPPTAPAQLAQDRDDGVVRPANFDDASFDDLAVGVPDATVAGAARAGRVTVLLGPASPAGRPG
jgi:hypothetical protein